MGTTALDLPCLAGSGNCPDNSSSNRPWALGVCGSFTRPRTPRWTRRLSLSANSITLATLIMGFQRSYRHLSPTSVNAY